ncbi:MULTISPECIES: D-hexose-6-phosphate mutarotase [Pseudomonas]|mgnify:CR=1 FL=1|uniref:Putative glucose-6-phosphate 1-epimerase n=1 Tax=Pseudomonas fluorescens (strain Pf0-1) TaxID=205922 RepID=Q3K4E9_PSEPF|nr:MULTISPECIES: D-hexose-6-phosphate mutarotase [Pseudomonas]ABA77355.1 aldose 1-epimerase family protein [Pseudomonas fluorescens Pf0-1]MBL0798162.1 D-hexose-6-phosphate mutarotase [Pseudomonas sp. B7]MBX8624800.1 D-hexose-6-phosphate mutarotase [Pseudomonas glycinae]MBY9022545.1 D-hexose-6-phosphate mutarotase [Pseudomonas fluorescens]MBY9028537.1 D-hexose-6-phosphate mutarotase [Pseudomonas fluorescens]
MNTPNVEAVKLDELNCWRIRHGQAEVLVAQQGAHILSYQVDGQPPLIWLNDKAVFKTGKSIRAGVPVCWPWFGKFERNPQNVQAMRTSEEPAGAHGFVRAMDWELGGIETEGESLKVEFKLPYPEGGFPEWPHQVDLTLTLRLDDQLHISLTSHNRGTDTVSISQALHSYFAVSDVRNVRVEGVDGLDYIETLDDWKTFTQQGDLRFAGETDRIYLDAPAQLSIVDPAWERRIVLTTTGSRTAVIWNPWIDRAAALSDMDNDGWQRMLCIETANVMSDVMNLAPDASHTMGVSVGSQPL